MRDAAIQNMCAFHIIFDCVNAGFHLGNHTAGNGAVAHQRLAEVPVEWDDVATVGVMMASGGYPGTYTTGHPIEGIGDVDDDVQVFIAGAKHDRQGRLVTSGGRVLCVVARGATVAEARAHAYDNVRRIKFDGAYYRTDIAARADEPLSVASHR